MALKLMYITNDPKVAQIAENAGVDRIFVDLEYIGKKDRQGGMDTVQSKHTLDDVKNVAKSIKKAELLVRVNPIHKATNEYISSKEEIDIAIENGAKILMLPYFKTVEEVETFIKFVNKRAKVIPLVETPEAVKNIDEILKLDIDEVFVGINDLSLGYRKKFMFELLTDGTVENLCNKFNSCGKKYGFGGIASLGKGLLPAEHVITEHYRLKSTSTILSRSFCNINKIKNIEDVETLFENGIRDIRAFEEKVEQHPECFEENVQEVKRIVKDVLRKLS